MSLDQAFFNPEVMDSIEDPSFNFDVNVAGTFKLLRAMRDASVNKLINASTGGASVVTV